LALQVVPSTQALVNLLTPTLIGSPSLKEPSQRFVFVFTILKVADDIIAFVGIAAKLNSIIGLVN